MKISDGRGANKKRDSKKNRAAVKKWFADNPGSTIIDCQRGLNLSYMTVRNHINSLVEDQDKNGKH